MRVGAISQQKRDRLPCRKKKISPFIRKHFTRISFIFPLLFIPRGVESIKSARQQFNLVSRSQRERERESAQGGALGGRLSRAHVHKRSRKSHSASVCVPSQRDPSSNNSQHMHQLIIAYSIILYVFLPVYIA